MDYCPSHNSSKYKVYQLECTNPQITKTGKVMVDHVTPFHKVQVDFNDYKSNCKFVSSEQCKITNQCALDHY